VGWALIARPKSTGKMPVSQYIKFVVGWALIARPKSTGKMPVPQYIKFLVGWAEDPAQKYNLAAGQLTNFGKEEYLLYATNGLS